MTRFEAIRQIAAAAHFTEPDTISTTRSTNGIHAHYSLPDHAWVTDEQTGIQYVIEGDSARVDRVLLVLNSVPHSAETL